MVSTGPMRWKEIAWNGIRFQVPIDWELAQIGTHYLMLEKASKPILEMKWGQIQGTFSHQAHLRQLATRHKKQLGKTVRECPIPSVWKKALGSYETTGFAWSGQTVGGTGLILYCPTCMKATLLQFYQNDTDNPDEVSQHLLASFQDHRQDGQMLWAAFDIRATVPAKLKMVRHHFRPGQFELTFSTKAHTVTLDRWGPASILLADKDLVQFARTVLHLSPTELSPLLTDNGEAVEWTIPEVSGRWTRCLNRVKIRPSLQRFRLWHLKRYNRILGVRAEGKKPIDPQFFENMCAGFECF